MKKKAIVYKFYDTEEAVKKMLENHYYFETLENGEPTNYLVKKKKVQPTSELVKWAINIYNTVGWQNAMRLSGINPEEFGIHFTGKDLEDGSQVLFVKQDEKFMKDVCKFKMIIDLSDDKYLGVTGENPLFPAVFNSKEILDKFFSKEISKLKELGLIKEIKVKV